MKQPSHYYEKLTEIMTGSRDKSEREELEVLFEKALKKKKADYIKSLSPAELEQRLRDEWGLSGRQASCIADKQRFLCSAIEG